jgi:Ion channel
MNADAENGLFTPRGRSLLVDGLMCLCAILSKVNIYWIIVRYSPCARNSQVFLELYLLFWTVLILGVLFFLPREWFQVAAGLAVYRLTMLAHSRLVVFFQGKSRPQNRRAALLTELWNAFEIVNCFAVLILRFGHEWEPDITNPITALYQSTLTFITLGYGEIHPETGCVVSQLLVIAELWSFVFFLVLIGPQVFAFSISRNDRDEA